MTLGIFSPIIGLALAVSAPFTLADSEGVGFVALCFGFVCCLIFFAALPIAGMWKIFEKAGQPGWHALVPIANGAVVAHIVGREWWWGVVPYLNFVPIFELAKAFGKEPAFGVGNILVPWICLPLLGFGDAQYQLERKQPLF